MSWSELFLRMPWRREQGFSLIEQIVAVALVAVVVTPFALLLSGLVRGASVSDAEVSMLILARSQMESVKKQPYQDLPASYTTISDMPEGYTVTTTASSTKTYIYPPPDATSTLPDEIQVITVDLGCPDCSPPVGPLTLEGHKVRR